MSGSRGSARGERGLALVTVLFGLSLLSLIAVSTMSAARVSGQLTRTANLSAGAELVAEAAMDRAILALTDPRADRRWRVDGMPYEIDVAGGHASVAIQDELGKIDLNASDGGLLVALFASAGLDPQQAAALVDKVLDWRDPSPAHRLNGAKDAEYRAAGYGYRPRSGPFQTVDELRLVMDMTPELYRRVAPALTVFSGRPSFDPRVAPRQSLLALPGMDAAKADLLLAARTGGTGSPIPAGQRVPAGIIDPAIPLAGRAFSIRASVHLDGGSEVVRTAVVRFTGDERRPFWILDWRDM